MSRLNLGFLLLLLVTAILVFAPTVVFWKLYGLEGVLAHWTWVAYLLALLAAGTFLIFTARVRPGLPVRVAETPMRRVKLGLAMYGLVAAILVIAPTLTFGQMYGLVAVVAYWCSVALLVGMTLSGLFLVFTAKARRLGAR